MTISHEYAEELGRQVDELEAENERLRDADASERDRCIAICEGWMERFEGMEVQYTSAREYACDAINDIIDLIRDGKWPGEEPAPLQSCSAAPVEPYAWVIPGDDQSRPSGSIDAMAWREGEFTKPLYAQMPAAPVETLDFETALRQALDDLTVEDGKCNWAEVANILPRMRGECCAGHAAVVADWHRQRREIERLSGDVAQPEKVPPFPAALEKTFEDHYWGSFQADREPILQHIRAVLREYQICTAVARAAMPPAAPVETAPTTVWRPIDTAPKGSTISVARKGGQRDDGSTYWYQAVGHYDPNRGHFHEHYGELYGEPEVWAHYPENPERCAAQAPSAFNTEEVK